MTDSTEVLPAALQGWLADKHHAVLVTVRRDGSPQTSNISFAFDPEAGRFGISVTDDRAKTRNLRRDPRGVLHVLGDDFWGFASISVRATPGEVTTEPGDAAGRALLDVYERITGGPHPDPQEFFEAMVEQHRLVLSLEPIGFAGSNVPS
jgi:PPOX class probable F420-dependent enzyme